MSERRNRTRRLYRARPEGLGDWEPAEKDDPRLALGSSTIAIELAPEGDGTMLRFVHRDLPNVAGGDDPGPDPWLTDPMKAD